MLSPQENRISMYFKVQTFLAEHGATLETAVPALTQKISEFKEMLKLIEETVGVANVNKQGYTLQKAQYRQVLRDRMLEANGALRSYALCVNNLSLSKEANYNKSSLDAMRDTEILFMASQLYLPINQNLGELDNYGFTAPQVASFYDAIENFRKFLQTPAKQRGVTKSANQQLVTHLENADNLLEIIDSMMETQRFNSPVLYNQYRADRLIDDNASGQSDPVAIETIAPNAIKVLFKVAFLPSRRFKIINDSDTKIAWGLSTNENNFTNNIYEVEAGAQSQRLSSAMDTEGDFVLVQNIGTQVALITLYEEVL